MDQGRELIELPKRFIKVGLQIPLCLPAKAIRRVLFWNPLAFAHRAAVPRRTLRNPHLNPIAREESPNAISAIGRTSIRQPLHETRQERFVSSLVPLLSAPG